MKKILNMELSADKRRLLENFFSLSILQGVNYILPLITLPYLVRVLGPEKFGLIAFAQAFIQYFNILTDYGFNLSATREISIHRENKEKVSEIFSSVMIIKLGLLVLSFLIMTVIVFSFEKFKKDWLIYYLTFGIVIGQTLFPVWFFQGMEKMKYITFLNITAKLIFTVSIFVFVHEVSDYIYVPLANALGSLISGVLSILLVFKLWNLKMKFPKVREIKDIFLNSTTFFLSRVVITIYTNTTSILLGFMWGYREVTYYNVSYKLVTLIRQPWDILNTAIYPFMSRYRDASFLKKVIAISFIMATLITIFLYVSSPRIIPLFFGQELLEAVRFFKILIFILPLISIHIFLGSSCLVVFGYQKYFNLSNIYATLIYLLVIFVLFLSGKLEIDVMLWLIVLVDALILAYRSFYVLKLRIL